MSYILDALRKADTDRELGGVPSLHAQAVPLPDEDRDRPSDSERRGHGSGPIPVWQWAAVGVAAAAVAVAGWALWTQGNAAPGRPGAGPALASGGAAPAFAQAEPAGGLVTAEARGGGAAAPAGAPMTVPPAAAKPDAAPPSTAPLAGAPPVPKPAVTSADNPARTDQPAAAPSRPAISVAPPPARPAPRSEPPNRNAAVPLILPAKSGVVPGNASTPVVDTASASAPSGMAAGRLPTWNELPPDVKRGIPALAISGAVYSNDPASRMLIVNGQLVREGDSLGPELVLEQIRQKSAVVRVRDQRATLSW